MTDPSLGVAVAFLAGVLSFLSPCVLPLVPSYLGFITGMTASEMTGRRRLAMVQATLFVLGFSVIFLLLGAGATALGGALRSHKDLVGRLGGVLILFFGLVTMGVVKIQALQMEARVHLQERPLGALGPFLVGMAFGAGWTPCIGPVLGGILSLAGTQDTMGRGLVLLGAYSAGLAIPFLVAAWAVESFFDWFQRFRRYLPWVQRVAGVLLVIVGILLITGEFTRLAGYLNSVTPEFLRKRL
ncbi:MAG TPA: cytochrome c biogenesis CcdA family protein [Gemmatimonadales bacterium]|jgi:cytochrome c-type biogenesis protein|nr:cytochrome c biogenesis CcdA family protein [Gemmatimonadales bacterium]